MTNTYKWTTPKGAKIEATITVEHITTETIYADGWNVEHKCNKWRRQVDAMMMNGTETRFKELHNERGTDCILIDRMGKDRLLIALPANVVEDIYGEERRGRAARQAAADAEMEEYYKHYDEVCKMLNY